MYKFSKVLTLFLLLLLSANVSYSQKAVTQTKETQAALNSDKVLEMLKDGNKRFLEGKELVRDYKEQIETTGHGQYPYAVILCCMDSRVAPEIVFDQGIGDIFTIRVAGNVIDDDVLGGMEYACKVVGVKLIVVLGHTSCGAVKGACDDVKLGNLTQLVAKIKPAVDVTETKGERNSKNHEFVDDAAGHNVNNQVDQLVHAKGTILGDMISNHEVGIVGGMYDVETGKVTFYTN